ncbi:hypothetical protein [Hymenobacter lapidarius]|uniref:hypothetical protein n=1 Tax=Hymenobacter lapidarius TaxID=1908237 RepID=UPI000F7A57A3|nr:hypothetical protein [Hymenobacter lapidarius]
MPCPVPVTVGAAGRGFGAGVTELLEGLVQLFKVCVTVSAVVAVTVRGLPLPPSLQVNVPVKLLAVTVEEPQLLTTFNTGVAGVALTANGVTDEAPVMVGEVLFILMTYDPVRLLAGKVAIVFKVEDLLLPSSIVPVTIPGVKSEKELLPLMDSCTVKPDVETNVLPLPLPLVMVNCTFKVAPAQNGPLPFVIVGAPMVWAET